MSLLSLFLLSIVLTNCGHNPSFIPPKIETCIVGTKDLRCYYDKPYSKPYQTNMIFAHPVDYQNFRNWCTDIVKNLVLCKKGYQSLPPEHEPPVDECISGTDRLFCYDVISGVRYDKPWQTAINYIGTSALDYNKIRNWCDTKAQELITCQNN